MSKRFGRQQAKKLREKARSLEQHVANLLAAHLLDRALLDDISDKLSRARAEIEGAKRILGGMTGMFPPETRLSVQDEHSLDAVRHGGYSVPIRPDHRGMRSIPLHALCTQVGRDADDVIHARITLKDKQVAYAMSDAMFHHPGCRRMIFTEAAQMMATRLLEAFPEK